MDKSSMGQDVEPGQKDKQERGLQPGKSGRGPASASAEIQKWGGHCRCPPQMCCVTDLDAIAF